ncbi:hypothetical protein ElyMa_004569600 [Elysia marginata]|uniref:Uncharacterized protein n=1 Tax=Elysia marginata TaxID=1093978 RepID=A0AAV4HVF3_9GAST|nr:hypothetical protein ElyMa_004569600 [Elysia marginata]
MGSNRNKSCRAGLLYCPHMTGDMTSSSIPREKHQLTECLQSQVLPSLAAARAHSNQLTKSSGFTRFRGLDVTAKKYLGGKKRPVRSIPCVFARGIFLRLLLRITSIDDPPPCNKIHLSDHVLIIYSLRNVFLPNIIIRSPLPDQPHYIVPSTTYPSYSGISWYCSSDGDISMSPFPSLA